jgi:hypothetical protein
LYFDREAPESDGAEYGSSRWKRHPSPRWCSTSFGIPRSSKTKLPEKPNKIGD